MPATTPGIPPPSRRRGSEGGIGHSAAQRATVSWSAEERIRIGRAACTGLLRHLESEILHPPFDRMIRNGPAGDTNCVRGFPQHLFREIRQSHGSPKALQVDVSELVIYAV